jgi:hypothetical protein
LTENKRVGKTRSFILCFLYIYMKDRHKNSEDPAIIDKI